MKMDPFDFQSIVVNTVGGWLFLAAWAWLMLVSWSEDRYEWWTNLSRFYRWKFTGKLHNRTDPWWLPPPLYCGGERMYPAHRATAVHIWIPVYFATVGEYFLEEPLPGLASALAVIFWIHREMPWLWGTAAVGAAVCVFLDWPFFPEEWSFRRKLAAILKKLSWLAAAGIFWVAITIILFWVFFIVGLLVGGAVAGASGQGRRGRR